MVGLLLSLFSAAQLLVFIIVFLLGRSRVLQIDTNLAEACRFLREAVALERFVVVQTDD